MARDWGFRAIDTELTADGGRKWYPGVRADDLKKALSDPAEMARQDPTSPMPRVVLERMRVVGEDTLTAADNALYKLLLTIAREQGFEKGRYMIASETAHQYLGTARWTDLKRSVARLSQTRVAFAYRNDLFREAGEVAMINVHAREGLGKNRGRNFLLWEFPSILVTVLRYARLYAYEEIAAFPKFSSKYAGRLYGLATSHASRGGWSTTPEKLAEALGWNASPFHWGSFAQRCLTPALEDIEKHVRRLELGHELTRSEGRGKKVTEIQFRTFLKAERRMDETRTMPLKHYAYRSAVAHDVVHPPHLMPSPQLIGRACTLCWPTSKGHKYNDEDRARRLDPVGANVAWRNALDEARLGRVPPLGRPPEVWHLRGEALLREIEETSLEKAFVKWLQGETLSAYHRYGDRTPANRDAIVLDGMAKGELKLRDRSRPAFVAPGANWSSWEDDDPEVDVPYLEGDELLPDDVDFSAADDVDDTEIPF